VPTHTGEIKKTEEIKTTEDVKDTGELKKTSSYADAFKEVHAKKAPLKTSMPMPKKGVLTEVSIAAKESTSEPDVPPGDDPFTPEALDLAWSDYLAIRSGQTGKESELIVLRQPKELKDATSVVLHLSNPFQADILTYFHLDLVSHLRKSLNNKNITVETAISETEEESLPYTNRDKFEFLAEINPMILKLKEELGFDPEF